MIPNFQDFLLPVLQCLRDGREYSLAQIRDTIAETFNLSDADINAKVPSGINTVLANRVSWACIYFLNAGLCSRPRRGHYQITEEGISALAENPGKIDYAFLSRYESFRSFSRSRPKDTVIQEAETNMNDGEKLSPQEALDQASSLLTAALKKEILDEISRRSPTFFENLVVKLLREMGYGGSLEDVEAGMVTGKSGDEGIDGVIKEDKLGFGKIYIQAKRWDTEKTVGRPEVQKFVGALAGQGAGKGLFVTTANFTAEAREYCQKQHTTKVVLINGSDLAQLMIDCNLGVATERVYAVKRIDTDFFSEE